MVSSDALTKPATIEWMSAYEQRVLKRFGYSASRGCGKAQLCPAFSLPDLFSTQGVSAGQVAPEAGPNRSGKSGKSAQSRAAGEAHAGAGQRPARRDPAVLLPGRDHARPPRRDARLRHPPDEPSAPAAADRRDAREPAPARRRQRAARRAAGARRAVGTAVASPLRRVETLLASLAVVALILLLAFRGDRRRALVPIVPIALASGWSALILFATRVPLNPMSVTLGALVIAISTEFSVLLSERHRQERLAGYDTVEALRRAYRRTGAAVAASGVTAIAGFGVLALSDIRMLRDFGLVTLIDLTRLAARRARRAAGRARARSAPPASRR